MITAQEGAFIVVNKWLKVRQGEKILIIVDTQQKEAELIKNFAEKNGAIVQIITISQNKVQDGEVFSSYKNLELFLESDIIIGSTTYSLITAKAVKNAIDSGTKFLSLPLSTQNGDSILTYSFIAMDTDLVKRMALPLIEKLNKAEMISVTTPLGTNISFKKKNRNASYFNGASIRELGFDSASFEVYVAICEEETNGVAYADISFGYIGRMKEPVKLEYKNGELVKIESSESGKILSDYMKSFNDKKIYIAAEFGIGLNKLSNCIGQCYIEDESKYGTFHIGMGRNITLGGINDAKGHFDIVFDKPTIYTENEIIMKNGEIVHHF